MSFYILLITLAVVLIPSFALISSSQSNNTLSNNSQSDNSENASQFSDNETSFASLSRSLAEKNQSSEEPVPPPPPSEDEANLDSNN